MPRMMVTKPMTRTNAPEKSTPHLRTAGVMRKPTAPMKKHRRERAEAKRGHQQDGVDDIAGDNSRCCESEDQWTRKKAIGNTERQRG